MTAKTITLIIYYGVGILAIILDIKHFDAYLAVAMFLIEAIHISHAYIKTHRQLRGTFFLSNEKGNMTNTDLLLVLFLIALVFLIKRLLSFHLTDIYIVSYFCIISISVLIQVRLTRNKTIPYYIIDSNYLIVNELFLKEYDLFNLQQISFDDFTEKYYFRFSDSKKLVIKKEDFDEAELNTFIEAVKNKSGAGILLSENIA
jgi:hypothetical protein